MHGINYWMSVAGELGLLPATTAPPTQSGNIPTGMREPGEQDLSETGGWGLAEQLEGLAVKAIEFGFEHAAVLAGEGWLYTLGSNAEWQLGVSSGSSDATMAHCHSVAWGAAQAQACQSAIPLLAEGDINAPTREVVAIATGTI